MTMSRIGITASVRVFVITPAFLSGITAADEPPLVRSPVEYNEAAVLYVDLSNRRTNNLFQVYDLSEADSEYRKLALAEIYRDVFKGWAAYKAGYAEPAIKGGARMPFAWVKRDLLMRALACLEKIGSNADNPLGIQNWDAEVAAVAPKQSKANKPWHSKELGAAALLALFGTHEQYRKLAAEFSAGLKAGEIGSE